MGGCCPEPALSRQMNASGRTARDTEVKLHCMRSRPLCAVRLVQTIIESSQRLENTSPVYSLFSKLRWRLFSSERIAGCSSTACGSHSRVQLPMQHLQLLPPQCCALCCVLQQEHLSACMHACAHVGDSQCGPRTEALGTHSVVTCLPPTQ